MRKFTILLAGIAIAIASNAQQNPFKRTKERMDAHNKIKSDKFDGLLMKTNATVPRLTKQSYWDNTMNNWEGSSALRNTYTNDLLVSALQMNYTQTDTFFRQSYTYNANKQLVQMLGEQKIAGIFVPSFRYTITYNNLKQFILAESYDMNTQTWIQNSRTNVEFNSRGEQVRHIYEQFNNGNWDVQFGYATYISYLNNTNKIVDLIDSSYNFNTMQMEAEYRELKSYNANNEAVEIMSYYNSGAGLEIVSKDSVFYTAGLPDKLIQYAFDSLSNTFQKAGKFDQIVWLNFDPTIDLFYNQPIGYWISSWQNNAWRPEERTSTTFPDANGSSVSLTEVYNSMNVWVNQHRYSELYDSRKNEIEYSDERYNNQMNVWETVYGEKFSYQYDANNNIIEEIDEEYNSTIGAYLKSIKYEYSDFITIALGVNSYKNTLEARLFPNPSTNGTVFVNVKMEASSILNIKITDMKGSVVYTDERDLGKGINTIELNNLKQGLYIVELTTEYGVARQKIAVK